MLLVINEPSFACKLMSVLPLLSARGVTVTNTPGVLTDAADGDAGELDASSGATLVVRVGAACVVDPAVVDHRAEVLVMAIFGIQTMVRAGAGQASSHASFAALHAMVDAWR